MRRKLFTLFLSLFLLSLTQISVTPAWAETDSSAQLDESLSYQFRAMANGLSYIKFVIYKNGNDLQIEYFDENKFNLHVNFLQTNKGVSASAEEIYQAAYYNASRKYFFGALIEGRDPQGGGLGMSFQVTARDALPIEDLIRIGQLIKKSSPYNDSLKYQPSGAQAQYVESAETRQRLADAGLPVFQRADAVASVYLGALTPGVLVKVSAKDIEKGNYAVKGNEVLLLDYVPDSLPPVRGVITSTPTSPNSHVSLLANMYSIPFLYVEKAWDKPALNKLVGKKVLLKAAESFYAETAYAVDEISEAEYLRLENLWLNKFPLVPVSVDLARLNTFAGFPELSRDVLAVDSCGAKATNGSFLNKVLGAKNSVEGFCIPFYFFHQFMTENKVGNQTLRQYVIGKLAQITPQSRVEEVQALIADVQKRVNEGRVNPAHLQQIKAMIVKTYGGRKEIEKIRIRSSSNAEDDERFNGAGLYESDGLKLKHVYTGNDEKLVESLKIVWSSLYGLRAVMARKMFKLDEERVQMGILVNQAFDETANGVSICRYSREFGKPELNCTIEGFPGGELEVTHPLPGKISEILRATENENYPNGVMPQVVQYSSETAQFETILRDGELGELFALQKRATDEWQKSKKSGIDVTLDFEWKRMTDKTTGQTYMAVKQVREVPKKVVFGLPEPAFLLSKELVFSTHMVNTAANLANLFFTRTLRIEIPALTGTKDTATLTRVTKVFTTDLFGVNYELPVRAVTHSETPWQSDDATGEESRRGQVDFQLAHPAIRGMGLRISYVETRKDGVTLSDNVVDTAGAEITLVLPEKEISGSGDELLEVSMGLDYPVRTVSPRAENYLVKGKLAARVARSEVGIGIYDDGLSRPDSVWLSKKVFKGLKADLEVTNRLAIISAYDSHAFEAGQYVSAVSAYVAPEIAQKAGLKKEVHYIVLAYGRNQNSEEDGSGESRPKNDDQILLLDQSKKVLARVAISEVQSER